MNMRTKKCSDTRVLPHDPGKRPAAPSATWGRFPASQHRIETIVLEASRRTHSSHSSRSGKNVLAYWSSSNVHQQEGTRIFKSGINTTSVREGGGRRR